ncbi:uncharacterized protein LOC117178676 [Belonocnema kinseyi]|uniref:uncharacterized protein LOC117178676 n=1 Tax=Belonocnema kinseyi TaxID=2817044 RepID=UPI00143D200B|nr:uncharacterized protein LOC117178676 [Belonocnema kinseyi]
MSILQINTNRPQPAHDLALTTAIEIGAGMLVICEPNKKGIEGRNDWTYDEELDTAIKVLDQTIPLKEQGKGNGFSFVETTTFTVYSCYTSPNRGAQELEALLQRIANCIRSRGEDAIVSGNFNAKSSQWGMKRTDRRGKILTEWLAQNDLIVQNNGDKLTFIRREYGSILDLNLATNTIGSRIRQWKVRERESLSDHNYVTFDIIEKSRPLRRNQRQTGWNTRKLGRDKLQNAIDDIAESQNALAAEEFSSRLGQLCNRCMPKRKKRWRKTTHVLVE